MPMYDYRCVEGHTFEDFKAYGDHKSSVCSCGKPAQLYWKKPPAVPGYVIPLDLRRKGFVFDEPGMDDYIKRRKKEREEESLKPIKSVVEKVYMDYNMPGEGGLS
jgi:hypothetical protein